MFFNEMLRHKTLMSEETLQTQNKEQSSKDGEWSVLPLYGPDSMMPSVVEA